MRRLHTKFCWLTALLLASSAVAVFAQGTMGIITQADAALQAGEADKAISLLNTLPQAGRSIAEAQNLQCRVRFTLRQWDAAAQACEQALRLDGQNSNYHLWMGRALGEKAGRASFLSAFSLGKRVRMEFEEAARLNPRNAEALSDLGEFYKEAPGVVGGGLSKAESVAAELERVDAARAHQLRARIAEERKDYGTAEREYKDAIATSPHPAFHWTTLASFYRRRERWTDLDGAIHNCLSAAARDRRAGVALYDGAGILIESRRDPALAARMLEDYLAGQSKTEEAPAFEAHLRLARLKEQLGDGAGAQRERAAAFAMAHEYKPAQDARN